MISCILLDLVICYIYSTIAKRTSYNIEEVKQCSDNKSKSFCRILKEYLAGFIDINIRLVGFIPGYCVRRFLYKNIFQMKIGKSTKIRAFSTFYHPWKIEIGDNTMVGQNCIFDGRNGIEIGNNVNISDYAAIYTVQHDINSPDFKGVGGKVKIGDRVWLSFRSLILPNISVGEGCVVAANAVVTKDCEEYSVYTGIPAKKKSQRNRDINYNLDIDGMHFI